MHVHLCVHVRMSPVITIHPCALPRSVAARRPLSLRLQASLLWAAAEGQQGNASARRHSGGDLRVTRDVCQSGRVCHAKMSEVLREEIRDAFDWEWLDSAMRSAGELKGGGRRSVCVRACVCLRRHAERIHAPSVWFVGAVAAEQTAATVLLRRLD